MFHKLVFSTAVSRDRQQISAHLQFGGYDPAAGPLGRLSAVAGARSAGVSVEQLAGHRRTPGRSTDSWNTDLFPV